MLDDVLKGLAVVLLLAVPGYVAGYIFRSFGGRNDPLEPASEFDQTMRAVSLGAFSAIIAIVWLLPSYPDGSNSIADFLLTDPTAALKAYLTVRHDRLDGFLVWYVIVIPCIVGLGLATVRRFQVSERVASLADASMAGLRRRTKDSRCGAWLTRELPNERYTGSWDQLVRPVGRQLYMAFTLTNGTELWGYFGENSKVVIRPDSEELFLEFEVMPVRHPSEPVSLTIERVKESKGIWIERKNVAALRMY